ncbi:LacI family DNA-binding transcriptional regulator [Acidipropionibacterium virtanenii]|uniref:Catabolite control protein A n=1 Tax=Acidipropionibacterium virtanenii TaxID=2057246 RepID=A0A344UTE0_9ACTN|nr:LacI family DNA-binding transcriptional regulator [Acidipropionibacterium virtanenii]AXE38538.1 Catabolite control protein A [Acidipropionibacterium virtanenii]
MNERPHATVGTTGSTRATVRDVAARAGVSPKTVSNVITGKTFVRPETRRKVDAALAELDYVPNLSARGLRNGRSGIIALALPDLETPYSAEMAHYFVEAARARSWGVQIEETRGRPDREQQLLSRALSRLVDGLILNPVFPDELTLGEDSLLPPTVLIGEVLDLPFDQVRVDPEAASYDMTSYLIGLGHRRIALLGSQGASTAFTAALRTQGYRRAMLDAGLQTDPRLEIACDEWSPRGGARAISAFIDSFPLPDAVFCLTDSLALGVISALWSRGIQVPRGISVAGFDDIADGEFAAPPLTTVSFNKEKLASRALDRLAERILKPSLSVRSTRIPHKIVARQSTVSRATTR